MRHYLASISTRRLGSIREIVCPHCRRSFRVRAGNALGDASRLRGMLAEHWEKEHPARTE